MTTTNEDRRTFRVAILEGGAWERWSPYDVQGRGLGGSQTCIVRLAKTLSHCGYLVSVFGDVEWCSDDRVQYMPRAAFARSQDWFAVIVARNPLHFNRPTKYIEILWAHDLNYGSHLNPDRAAHMDAVVVPSRWHRRYLETRYPFLAGGVTAVSNGIDLRYFSERFEPRPVRAIYSSAPDRGLDVVLEIWPEVRERLPEAELVYCAAPAYAVRAKSVPALRDLNRRIAGLANQAGVRDLGALGQASLAKWMCASRVWVAPSWSSVESAPVRETFCISAVEAQAAACWPVATSVGAMAEVIAVGHLIREPPGTAAWRSALIEGIVAGLSSNAIRRRVSARGPAAAVQFDWPLAFAPMTDLLERLALCQR